MQLRKREYHPNQYQDYLKGKYKYNFFINVVDVVFFKLGLILVSIEVILPAFAHTIGASNTVIAMIPAIFYLGWMFPQLFSAFHIEKLLRKKSMVLFFGIFQRVPWLLFGIATLYLVPDHLNALLVLFIITLSVVCMAGGINSPAWIDYIGKSIPLKKRGYFFGTIELV